MSPEWLTVLAWIALASGGASCVWLVIVQMRRPQEMWSPSRRFTWGPRRTAAADALWATLAYLLGIKADTLSLTAFEMGLFGWMAITHFFVFHPDVKPDQPTYWFLTAYPMNIWLIRRGYKEPM